MNDYLGNLAARTLGRMPVLQPRLASRFEPVESPAALPGDAPGFFQQRAAEPAEVEEELEAAANHDSIARPARLRRLGLLSGQTAETEESLGAAGPDGADQVSHASPRVSIKTPTTQSQPDVLSQSLSHAQAEEKDMSLLPSRPSSTLTEANRADDAARSFADLAPAPQRQETLLQAETRRADSSQRQDTENRRDSDDEKTTGLSPEGSSRAQALQPADWLSPLTPPAVASPQFTQPIEREPVIKVTIGRVEVRAVAPTPPTPTVKAAEQTPRIQALPLSEYLRRRDNGEL